MTTDGTTEPDDGRIRCPWSTGSADYAAYHDHEWGRPVTDDVALYEKLVLEGFQSGLSWLTILRKRPAFRRAFAGFDPFAVERFGPADVERLLGDAGIVRHRGKIEAAIANAAAVRRVQDAHGSLAALVWAFAPEPGPAPRTMGDLPARTPESTALSKALQRNGFRFVGPTTAYAFMQSMGLVNDHLADCWVRAACANAQASVTRPQQQPARP